MNKVIIASLAILSFIPFVHAEQLKPGTIADNLGYEIGMSGYCRTTMVSALDDRFVDYYKRFNVVKEKLLSEHPDMKSRVKAGFDNYNPVINGLKVVNNPQQKFETCAQQADILETLLELAESD